MEDTHMRRSLITGTISLAFAFFALPVAAEEALTGTFVGIGNHVATGTVHVTSSSVDLQGDFTFDGAPDPKIGFGKNGAFDDSTIIEPLKANTGEQSYAVPDGIDVSAYNEVYVWCEKYSVPLGVAKLQ